MESWALLLHQRSGYLGKVGASERNATHSMRSGWQNRITCDWIGVIALPPRAECDAWCFLDPYFGFTLFWHGAVTCDWVDESLAELTWCFRGLILFHAIEDLPHGQERSNMARYQLPPIQCFFADGRRTLAPTLHSVATRLLTSLT